MQQQAVGGGQQYFEKDEQVEQVGCQEGAIEAHQLDLEQGMEAGTGAIPAGASEQQGADTDDPGQGQQQRRKVVQHQYDTERRGPVAGQIDANGFGLALGAHPQQQTDGDGQAAEGRQQVEACFYLPMLLAQQQHHRCSHQG